MTDPLNEIREGTALTPEQKAALAKSNEIESAQAHMLAAQHRAQDEREQPVVQVVADSVKEKLKSLPPL